MSNPESQSEDGALREEYSRLAARYDVRWAAYLERTTREVLTRLGARPGERILDVGCGTGFLLERLRRAAPNVVLAGVDPVPEMLAAARRRLPASESVDLRVTSAERLPFADESRDAVIFASVLHYVREPRAALVEARRVLRPGGRLVLTDWCGDFLTCRLVGMTLCLRGRSLRRVYRRDECRRMLEDTGFHDVKISTYHAGWLWGMVLVRAAKPG